MSYNVHNNLSVSIDFLFNALAEGLKILISVHPLCKM